MTHQCTHSHIHTVLMLYIFLCHRLVVALAVTLGLFAIELVGFFSGVSMFSSSQGLLCILYANTVGPTRAWCTYWYIYIMCKLLILRCHISCICIKWNPNDITNPTPTHINNNNNDNSNYFICLALLMFSIDSIKDNHKYKKEENKNSKIQLHK